MTNKTSKQSPKKKSKGTKGQQQSNAGTNGQKNNQSSKNLKKGMKQYQTGNEFVDMQINDQKILKHLPCDHCQDKHFKTFTDEELRAQVVSSSQYKFTKGFMGCEDGHMTPYDHLIGMLKLEREETNTKFPNIFGIQKPKPVMPYSFMPLGELDVKTLGLQKQTCSAFSEQEKQNKMVIREIKLPNLKNTEIRNQVVDEIIVNIGSKLRQSNQTIQLAARVFDLVSVAQNLSTNYEPSKNSPSNLKLLAAQCLLLASKFVEVSRLYPAELVYQVKSWGHSEYDILRAGQVEEYILNIIQFDLGFLTPQQFLEVYTELMDHGMPADKCPRATCMEQTNDRQIMNGLKGRAKLYSMTISNMIVSNLGHAATIRFLPSQIAALSLQLAWKAVILDEKHNLGHLLQKDSQQQTSQIDICLRESLKVFGYESIHEGGLKDIVQAIQGNSKVQEFLSALGLESLNDKKTNTVSSEVKSPKKGSPSKLNSIAHSDDVKQTESPSKKQKMRLFDMSPSKNQDLSQQNKSKDNMKKFEMIMRNSFGLSSSSEIYPQYEATPLEKSIGITERFFGRKPKYFNIMNKTFKKQQQASDLITVQYQVNQSEFNTHINLPQLFNSKIKKIQNQEKVKASQIPRKTRFAEGDSNDKENQKNTMNFDRPRISTGEMTLKKDMVKSVNAGTGIGSDQQHSNQQTTTDDRSILEEETMSGNQRGFFQADNHKLFDYNPNNVQKLQLLSKAYQRMDYYSSQSSQNMSNPKYFGQNLQEFRPGQDIIITDDCSMTDSNCESKGAPQAEHEEMIRQLLRQHSEVTDLRILDRAAEGSTNNQTDEAYLAAIRTSFGGCQPINVDTEGPIKQFPSLMDRDTNGIGVYAPLRQRQGNIKIHDHMLNSSSNSPFSLNFYEQARGENCRTPHTPVRVSYSEQIM